MSRCVTMWGHLLLVAAVSAVCACSRAQTSVGTGWRDPRALVLHYDFSGGTAPNILDKSRNTFDATVTGAERILTPYGAALRFSSQGGRLVSVPSPRLDLAGDLTLAVRLRIDPSQNPPDPATSNQRLIFGDTASASIDRCFNLRLNHRGNLFFEWGNGQQYQDIELKPDALDGSWQLLVAVCDSRTQKATIYLDGRALHSEDLTVPITTTANGKSLMSGAWFGKGKGLNGSIADIRVYRVALTATDVQDMVDETRTPAQKEPGLAPPVNPDGLAAWYTFEEGTGTTLRDHSGNGNHGSIHGAEYVDSPFGKALRFDGIDDYVNLGHRPSLQISGDFTIEAWIKTHYLDTPAKEKMARHRIIVGTDAPLSIQRNYNLRIRDTGAIFAEWSDGGKHPNKYHHIETDGSFLDGDWKHIALVVEAPDHAYITCNGTVIYRVGIEKPLPAPTDYDIHIGGWFAGHFKGEIAELRIYRRALSARELWLSDGRPLAGAPTTLDLSTGYSYHRRSFILDVLCMSPSAPPAIVDFTITKRGDDQVILSDNAKLPQPTRPDSGRFFLQHQIEGTVPDPGRYEVLAVARDSNRQELASATSWLPVTTMPEWLGCDEGKSDDVPEPWSPCTVEEDDGNVTATVWGREYRFGNAPFLSALTATGHPLLTGPVRLHCRANDRTLALAQTSPRVVEKSPAHVLLQQTDVGGPLRFRAHTRLEFDGFMRVDWELEAENATTLDQAVIEIPIDPDSAALIYSYRGRDCGELPPNWSSAFMPILWIGDEERGLSWVAESDQYWAPADPTKTFQFRRSNEQAVLRIDVIGTKVSLKPGDRLTYAFGLLGTPTKPLEKTCWDYRIERKRPYANEYAWTELTYEDGTRSLEYYRKKGARALNVWRWWDVFSHTLPVGHEKQFPKLVEEIHEYDLQVIPYMIGFLMSELAPEYPYFHNDMLIRPIRNFPIYSERLGGITTQMCHYPCRKGAYQDWVMATTAQCIDTYDIDGSYLDGGPFVLPCKNTLHGCGYKKSDGSIAPTYPVFAARQFYKRLYRVVTNRKPNGLIDSHTSSCMYPHILAFSHTAWGGEHLQRPSDQAFILDTLDLDAFRAGYLGRNMGVAADLLYYRIKGYKTCLGLGLLHDVPTRAETRADFDMLSRLWAVREQFGVDDARFVGYWDATALVTPGEKDTYVSLWVREGDVLAVLVNYNRNRERVSATFSPGELDLGRKFIIRDVWKDNDVTAEGATVSADLPTHDWTLLRLTAAP